MTSASQTCVVTGATGFVGGRMAAQLRAAGLHVNEWSRRAGAEGAKFQLGQEVDPRAFAGIKALVHCAYDFSPRRWDDIAAINVRGSENLFRAARKAGIERIVFISSASAYPGCRSLYGRAKMEIEAMAQSMGAIIVRPGLVYGDQPGGVFGKLVEQVKRSRIIPLIGGGRQVQHLVHEADLGELVQRALAGKISPAAGSILLAHEQPWPMRRLLEDIAAALKRQPQFLPVPWRFAWLGLKSLETLGLPAPFRSDSMLGLMYPNPNPNFTVAQSLGITCRPLALTSAMLV